MPKTELRDLASLRERVGQEVAVGDWLTVTQERIDLFAEATGDRQWIHVDRERAAAESPFGGPIAHGFLTLSLIPQLTAEALVLPPARMWVNYGVDRVRFTAPVRAGGRVRPRFTLLAVEDVPGGAQIKWRVTIELESSGKPACIAETILRAYGV